MSDSHSNADPQTLKKDRPMLASYLIASVLCLSTSLFGACQPSLETFDGRARGEIARSSLLRLVRPSVPPQTNLALSWHKWLNLGDVDLTFAPDGTVTYRDNGHMAVIVSDQTFSGNFVFEYEVPDLGSFHCPSQVGVMLASVDNTHVAPPGDGVSEAAFFWHNSRGQNNLTHSWTQDEGWKEVPLATGDRVSIHHENGVVKLYKNFTPGAIPLEVRNVSVFRTEQLKLFAKFVPDLRARTKQLRRPRVTLN